LPGEISLKQIGFCNGQRCWDVVKFFVALELGVHAHSTHCRKQKQMRTKNIDCNGLAQVRRVGVENVPPPFTNELYIVQRANIRERRKDAVYELNGESSDGAFRLELLGHLAGGHDWERSKMVAGRGQW